MSAVDRVIEFLEQCGELDIEAGIGALLGLGDPDRIERFRAGLERAISDRNETK